MLMVEAVDLEDCPPETAITPNEVKIDQRQRQQPLMSSSSFGSRSVCRICHTDSWSKEPLISPCRFEALRIWISHPRNRRNIRADILIFTFLTVFTAGLSSVCLLGSHYLFPKKIRIGFSETWTRGAITLFMIIVILGYVTSIYLLIRNQATPWYRWWRGAVNIRLLLDPSTLPPLEVEIQQHQRSDLEDEHR